MSGNDDPDFVPPRLDVAALRGALDDRRRDNGLSWVQVAEETQIPTIRTMGTSGFIQADAVVITLQWLGRLCDDFVVRQIGRSARWSNADPPRTPPLFARFDTIALHKVLDAARRESALTWRHVARDLGTTQDVLARLKRGGRIDAQLMVAGAEWARVPVESLLQPSQPSLGPARQDVGGSLRRSSSG